MSTVGEVIDRTQREYLYLADDQPVQAPLLSSITASATSIRLVGGVLAPDEVDVYVEGALVEVDTELMLVTAVGTADYPTSIDLTVRRGMAGTDAVAHTAPALVVASPTYTRRAVFDAVADNVVALYPSLYRVATTTITTAGYTSVPADVVDPLHFTWLSGSRLARADVELHTDLAPALSATGKAVTVFGASGVAGTLTYRALFTRPTSEADDMQTLGVQQDWERIVVVGAAAQVLAGRELDQVTQEYVTEQMRGQGYPPLSASRQRNELVRLYQLVLQQASSAQMAQRDTLVTMSGPRFGALR